jgi:hypothetical protein
MAAEHKAPLSLDGIGQLGHPATSSAAVLTAEQRSSHDRAAKQSTREDADPSDQADAHGDHAKFTRDSSQIRDDDSANFNKDDEGTFATEQMNDNVRGTKSGAPANSGSKNSGGGR